jgi:serine/threonine protein kinase
MVSTGGQAKVLDFGLAAAAAQTTGTGLMLGTPAYMSPEQARGETVTTASDIFSLGVVLYELAVGRHPFQTFTMANTLQAIICITPPAPASLNPEIPAVLDTLILQMLAKDAALRPTAQAVAQALAGIRERDYATARGDARFASLVVRQWHLARAWLYRKLNSGKGRPEGEQEVDPRADDLQSLVSALTYDEVLSLTPHIDSALQTLAANQALINQSREESAVLREETQKIISRILVNREA